MTPIKLKSLQIHNDVRVHPQKIAGRTFRTDMGYSLEWYAPSIFRVSILVFGDKPQAEDNPLIERWFGITNCEHWEVDGPAEDVLKSLAGEETRDRLIISGIIELNKVCSQILGRLHTDDKSSTSRTNSK
jgi:hypothetical protein